MPTDDTTSTTSTYQVSGMTCAHCVDAVTQEVAGLPGVRGVDVDLEAGSLTVVSDAPLDEGAVAAAVDEAGYELAGPAQPR